MKKLKIGARLGAAFGFVIALLVLICVFAMAELGAAKGRIRELTEQRYAKSEYAHQIKDNAHFSAQNLRNALLSGTAGDADRYMDLIADSRHENQELVGRLDQLILAGDERQLFRSMKERQMKYVAVREEIIDMLKQGRMDEARDATFGELASTQTRYFQALDALVKHQSDRMIRCGNDAELAERNATWTIGALALSAILLSAVCGWSITRSISGPARVAVDSANRVARGDLTSRIDASSSDEMGQLMRALKKMNASLLRAIRGVRGSIESISSAAEQISSENTALAGRTEEQAASLEQTAASMTLLAETVKQTTDSARQANVLASDASQTADTGHAAVKAMIATMDQVSSSASKISEINGLIEGIAFQTNILALNAAVEAARAGEQGRGFAVVAGEVRTLAVRSSVAAKEIKELIQQSVGMIGKSSQQAEEVGAVVSRIKQAVADVSSIVAEISSASAQQAREIQQVHSAIDQMDHVTQQNATLVEEAAAAARSLDQQARELRTAISVFKVEEQA
ncbi:methyl-accepting chemotaxis protein [Paraburkholderia strydomiana]